MNAYKPFLISEFKTGLFNYLQPWIRPTEAWQPLQDAFVYRGTVQSRYGETVFGYMTYEDNNIAVGNGGKTYAGTLAVHPIRPGSFAPSDGIETFSDNGMGVLTGNMGGTGTINYTTGAWTLHFNANVANDTDIYGIYEPIPATNRPIMGIQTWTDETNGLSKLLVEDTRRAAVYNGTTKVFDPIDSISQQLWQGDGTTTSISFSTGWSAVTPYTNVWAPFSITVTDGTSTIVDDGSGNLSSSGNLTGGTVSYSAGTISLIGSCYYRFHHHDCSAFWRLFYRK